MDLVVVAQENNANKGEYMTTISKEIAGLTVEAFASTLLYTIVGIIILVISVVTINAIFGLHVKKELIKENNTAVGITIAGLAVAIGIIIAGTISS